VARFALGTRRFLPEGARVELTEVNGQLALIFRAGERAYLVLAIEVEAQRIQTVRIVVNPEKLAHI
jgi:RNA polymerase sigma-70 factor, ECF subfamily